MAKITIHAGDFGGKGTGFLCAGVLVLNGIQVPLETLSDLEIATEENVKKLAGTIGWGIAGVAVFGLAGAVAGLIAGGRKKEITFIAKFEGGKRLFATTDKKTYTQLQASIFSRPSKEVPARLEESPLGNDQNNNRLEAIDDHHGLSVAENGNAGCVFLVGIFVAFVIAVILALIETTSGN